MDVHVRQFNLRCRELGCVDGHRITHFQGVREILAVKEAEYETAPDFLEDGVLEALAGNRHFLANDFFARHAFVLDIKRVIDQIGP